MLFYFTLIDEINDEVDDALEARAEVIVKRVLAGRSFPFRRTRATTAISCTKCRPNMPPHSTHERYSDEEIFIPERDDKEPARVRARCSAMARGNGAN